MTNFLSEWEHKATTKLETKHSELIEERKVTVKLEKKHSELIEELKVTVKLEKKHFEPIVNAPPVELLSE